MSYFNCYILLILNLILIINSQNVNENICNSKESCGKCIQESGCIWCFKDVEPTSSFSRCIAKSTKTDDWCPDSLIIDPKPSLKIIKDLPLKSAINLNDPVVQIKPQRVQLKLRRNEEFDLHFEYSQAIDYPVDLYYLMDLSHSMEDDRENLIKLGDQLADAMRKLTKNFQLGFGSFVEKVTLPFVYIVPGQINKPECKNCAYSFINHVRLDSDTSRFTTELKKTHVSGNLDTPEGGLDAILQTIVCKDQIGWRDDATHLLVFSTDSGYHLAGDGKLAGIVEPHDGGCYLNEKGEYTHALKFDYPSISFINRHVQKHNIDLLFAVTKGVEYTYTNLKHRIAGAQLEILGNDSNNVVDLVTGFYKKLKKNVVMIDIAPPDIHIEYFSSCLEGKTETNTNKCNDIRYNQKVKFRAKIRATSCINKTRRIEIKPRSLSESLIVDIEVQCDCDCEQPNHVGFEINSSACNSSGSLTCGVCSCNPGRVGKFCECDDDAGLTTSVDVSRCKVPGKSDELVCSGRGYCKCGKCICNKGKYPGEEYSGTYCQCDNFSCKKPNNKLCSGHGTCECRHCKCEPGFTGTDCGCDTSEKSCIEPGKKEPCSGKGTCECGECKCHKTPKLYWGKFCEMCSDCPGKRCSEFVSCVECKHFQNTGKYTLEECNFHCINFTTVPIKDLDEKKDPEKIFKTCEHIDNNGCTMLFKYYTYDMDTEIPIVYVQNQKKCPAKVSLLPIMLTVIGTIVLAGIILLAIWKIATEVHDRREFIRFEKERQNAKWGCNDNPLYRAATTTIENPIFKKS